MGGGGALGEPPHPLKLVGATLPAKSTHCPPPPPPPKESIQHPHWVGG